MEKKHILIVTAALAVAVFVTIIAFVAIVAIGSAIRYVPVSEPTVEPVATIAAEASEPTVREAVTPTAEAPERPTIIANDELDSAALEAIRVGLECKHFFCTTRDNRLLYVFPGRGRDAVLIGKPDDLSGVHEMVEMLLVVREKVYSEDARNFLQDRVVDQVCSYRVPNYSESKDFGDYTLTVAFTKVYERPGSGGACFVLIKYN